MPSLFADTELFLDWQTVSSKSGWVRAAAYDEITNSLYVRFKEATVQYKGVPKSMYQALISAPSAGTYIHQSGLYKWPYTRV